MRKTRLIATAAVVVSLTALAGCESETVKIAKVDEALVCGVVAPEDLKGIASMDPLSWGQLTPSRALRMDQLTGDDCNVVLKQGEMFVSVIEFAPDLPAGDDKQPRCPRVEKLAQGWICESDQSTDVLYDFSNRSIGLVFTGAAGDGITVAQAERLAVAVNAGIEALDKRHAG